MSNTAESISLAGFTAEQRREIQEIVRSAFTAPQAEEKETALAVVPDAPKGKGKSRLRTKRMRKVNGLTLLMHLVDNNRKIRVSCLEDLEQTMLLPVDWALANRAAKAIATFVKAKGALASFKNKAKQ